MRLYRQARAFAKRISLAFPRNVTCTVCGWTGRVFSSDEWHPHTICWKCGSQVRHRLIAAILQQHEPLPLDRLVRDKRVLHFAPEPQLSRVFQSAARVYHTANIDGSADLRADMTAMPEIADGSYDLVVACDVLEHVSNDRAALAEIRRVLAPGGYAILAVPQKDGLRTTYEDPTITDPKERETAFGQWDHLRIYGDDFPGLVTAAGFHVTTIDHRRFAPAFVRRNVLFPPVLSVHPLATNYRKVFFARR